MKITDAANILHLSGNVNEKMVKDAYRRAAMKYHPDRNPAGAEMMKVINAAYDTLKDFCGEIPTTEGADVQDYPEALSAALGAILELVGIEIEVCGAWVWVSGQTFTHKDVLKAAGFKYASKKKSWYFRPEDWSSSSRGSYSMEDIREKYGSEKPHRASRGKLQSTPA